MSAKQASNKSAMPMDANFTYLLLRAFDAREGNEVHTQ
jgi:hypothetical protein